MIVTSIFQKKLTMVQFDQFCYYYTIFIIFTFKWIIWNWIECLNKCASQFFFETADPAISGIRNNFARLFHDDTYGSIFWKSRAHRASSNSRISRAVFKVDSFRSRLLHFRN